MPVITDIQRQRQREVRFSVYVDDRFAFGLDDLELSTSGFRIGQELSKREVEEWQNRSAEGKAYNAALRYLSYRLRSRSELLRYLHDKEYEDITIELTLERLVGLGLVDDLVFARTWIADRMRLKPRSRAVLIAELRQKGIASEVIAAALAEIEPDDEIESLRRLITKKRSHYDEAKLIQYLRSKGYNYGLIKEAIASESD